MPKYTSVKITERTLNNDNNPSQKMTPSKDELNKIAADAERDLNSYQAKQGLNNVSVEDAGVDSIVEKKFPGAEVKVGTEISTNAGYNRRIPPEEGGELDDRGR